jgi:hypothetical protein
LRSLDLRYRLFDFFLYNFIKFGVYSKDDKKDGWKEIFKRKKIVIPKFLIKCILKELYAKYFGYIKIKNLSRKLYNNYIKW